MSLSIQTRSTHKDYDFLGKRPAQSWWSTVYGRFSAFEDFTVLLEIALSGHWRAYLGGIPSGRRDKGGTPIRYALAGEGTVGDDDAQVFYKLFFILLDDYSRSSLERRLNTLGKELDASFPQDFLDGLGKHWYGEATYEAALYRLHKIADTLEYGDLGASPFDKLQGSYTMRHDTAAKWLGLARLLISTKPPLKPLYMGILNLSPDQGEIRNFWQKASEGVSPLLFTLEGLEPGDPLTGLLFTLEASGEPPQNKGFLLKLIVGMLLILILGIIIARISASLTKHASLCPNRVIISAAQDEPQIPRSHLSYRSGSCSPYHPV
jgi:hypothetical protein